MGISSTTMRKASRDGDGDGWINDGTPQPAPRKKVEPDLTDQAAAAAPRPAKQIMREIQSLDSEYARLARSQSSFQIVEDLNTGIPRAVTTGKPTAESKAAAQKRMDEISEELKPLREEHRQAWQYEREADPFTFLTDRRLRASEKLAEAERLLSSDELDDGEEIALRAKLPKLRQDAKKAARQLREAELLGRHSQSRFEV